MQNKARLELADYEAVSERGLLVSTPPSLYICSLPVLAPLSGLIPCLFVLTDTENVCYSVCHCIICNFPFTKAIKWTTRLFFTGVFFFCMWAGIIKDGIQPCTVHSMRSKHNQPRSLKSLSFPVCSLFYLQESLARLQRAFARKWEFIFMQAEAQAK